MGVGRGNMKELLGAVFCVMLALSAAGCPGSGETTCLDTFCGEACVNLNFDTQNCGTCGTACNPDQRCEGGSCVSACASPLVSCSGFCVDTSRNPDNCGDCGNSCTTGQMCQSGTCTGGSGCDPGLTDCGGTCVDTRTSAAHCGACNTPCTGVCSGGTCGTSCETGETECDGTCVDTNKDPQHCGNCTTACTETQTCQEGVCSIQCEDGMRDCDGTCVDTTSSGDHCGRCGNFCNEGQVCSDSSCVTGGCPDGETDCSGSCVNTSTDRTNCGTCGNVCPTDQGCLSGACATSGCAGDLTDCSGDCVNTATDMRNCGACGVACRADQVCRGSCQCGSGRTECSEACVDTGSDPANCGSCGETCSATEACVSGDCGVNCTAPTTACDGYCVNTNNDRNHCGNCTTVCSAGDTCIDGRCTAGVSVPGDTCSSPITVTGGGRFTGTMESASPDYSATCGGIAGEDLVFQYTISEETDVFLNTYGSGFDTVLYVQSTCGGGTEIGCNDDGPLIGPSELVLLDQPAGTYYVVVDSYFALDPTWDDYDYVLDIYFSAPSLFGGDACGEPEFFDFATVTSIEGDTTPWWWFNARDDTLTCSGDIGGLDMVYYFVVESSTTVTFATCGTTGWDTILDLRSVCDDPWSSVECVDDGCAEGYQSNLTATLEPGVYYLWIDGWDEEEEGTFEIAVTH